MWSLSWRYMSPVVIKSLSPLVSTTCCRVLKTKEIIFSRCRRLQRLWWYFSTWNPHRLVLDHVEEASGLSSFCGQQYRIMHICMHGNYICFGFNEIQKAVENKGDNLLLHAAIYAIIVSERISLTCKWNHLLIGCETNFLGGQR